MLGTRFPFPHSRPRARSLSLHPRGPRHGDHAFDGDGQRVSSSDGLFNGATFLVPAQVGLTSRNSAEMTSGLPEDDRAMTTLENTAGILRIRNGYLGAFCLLEV